SDWRPSQTQTVSQSPIGWPVRSVCLFFKRAKVLRFLKILLRTGHPIEDRLKLEHLPAVRQVTERKERTALARKIAQKLNIPSFRYSVQETKK
ncbi:MAG: hypothetical protein DRH50_11715, partial [Deltaproteobacteria bacterium]